MAIKINMMKQKILMTTNSWSPVVLRAMLALVIFPHGAQKLFGWFGGFGFEGTMNYFTTTVGLPWVIGFLVILFESVGTFLLLIGAGTRIMAFAYLLLATGILFTSHVQHGFFLNWYGNQAGEGYEYFLLWIAMALALLISGAGKYSIDRLLVKKVPVNY